MNKNPAAFLSMKYEDFMREALPNNINKARITRQNVVHGDGYTMADAFSLEYGDSGTELSRYNIMRHRGIGKTGMVYIEKKMAEYGVSLDPIPPIRKRVKKVKPPLVSMHLMMKREDADMLIATAKRLGIAKRQLIAQLIKEKTT